MGYSAEVVRRARARLAEAREERESENRQHLAYAYEQVPRLRQIDIELRRTMATAAQAAFVSGSRDALEEAKQASLALQREREALAMEHFEEGFLDDSPICDRCDGLGYVGSTMCQCLQELCRQEQKKELTFLSGGKESFSQFRLDYYPDFVDPKIGVSPRQLMERNFRTCRTYAATFTQNSGNLLFNGGTGLGKTFLSACIARTVADRGYSVVYETASRLFTNLERAKFSADDTARQNAERYNACDLLIVDDLGTEMPSQFVVAALYALLNDRLMERKPMVISTNLNIAELKQRYSPQIGSRLEGSFTLLPFLGEDIRVMKNKGL